jgi:hypothetical protein
MSWMCGGFFLPGEEVQHQSWRPTCAEYHLLLRNGERNVSCVESFNMLAATCKAGTKRKASKSHFAYQSLYLQNSQPRGRAKCTAAACWRGIMANIPLDVAGSLFTATYRNERLAGKPAAPLQDGTGSVGVLR